MMKKKISIKPRLTNFLSDFNKKRINDRAQIKIFFLFFLTMQHTHVFEKNNNHALFIPKKYCKLKSLKKNIRKKNFYQTSAN